MIQKWMVELAVFIVGVTLAIFGLFHIYHEGISRGYEKAQAEYTAQSLKDSEAARLREQSLQTQLTEAQNARSKAEADLLTTVINNRNLVGKLRQQLDTANGHLSSYTNSALIARVNTLTDLFEQCTSAYADMATKADEHAADAKLMQDSWPK